jgi:hypothetical protein
MTDEEEPLLPAPSSNGRGKVMLGYCYIADAEWGVSYLISTIKACGVQSNPMVVATLPTCLGPRTPSRSGPEGAKG